MTIGINNIFIILWFMIMLGCGSVFFYWTFFTDFFISDIPIIGKFFVALLMMICFSLFIFLLIKFRILFIYRNKISFCYPFTLKYRVIDLDSIHKIEWKSTIIKATLYKQITIISKNGNQMSLSDLEFENFDTLVSKVPFSNTKEKLELEEYQAETQIDNLWIMIFSCVFIILIVLFLNLGKNIYHWVHLIFYGVGLLLIYASVKRIKKHEKFKKTRR